MNAWPVRGRITASRARQQFMAARRAALDAVARGDHAAFADAVDEQVRAVDAFFGAVRQPPAQDAGPRPEPVIRSDHLS